MSSSTTTRPVNLTDEATLRAKALAWIADNGRPARHLVSDAIVHSLAAGDPFCDVPFRRMLLLVDAELGEAS